MNALPHACTLVPSLADPLGLWKTEIPSKWQMTDQFKAEQCVSHESEKENCSAVSLRPCIFPPLHRVALSI